MNFRIQMNIRATNYSVGTALLLTDLNLDSSASEAWEKSGFTTHRLFIYDRLNVASRLLRWTENVCVKNPSRADLNATVRSREFAATDANRRKHKAHDKRYKFLVLETITFLAVAQSSDDVNCKLWLVHK